MNPCLYGDFFCPLIFSSALSLRLFLLNARVSQIKTKGLSFMSNSANSFEYVGFWLRALACVIDTILVFALTAPIILAIYGQDYFLSPSYVAAGPVDFLLSYVLPAIAVLIFWFYKSATPGKMAIGARIVDAYTGEQPSRAKLLGRYCAYYVSLLPLVAGGFLIKTLALEPLLAVLLFVMGFVGFYWAGWDARKQAWHDKLAGTLVVR